LIEAALRVVLIGDAAVNALISGRCWPVEAAQAPDYPYTTYQVITGDSDYAMEGASGLARRRLQVNCDGGDADQAQALARAVTARLGGFKGKVTVASVSPPVVVTIQGAFKVMERDEPLGELQRSGLRPHRKSLDFDIWFEE
jgi:hypothetical protein